MALLMCVAFLSGYNFYDCSTSLVSQWDIARAAWGSLLKYTIPYTHSSQPPYLEAAHPPPCRIEDGWRLFHRLSSMAPFYVLTMNERTKKHSPYSDWKPQKYPRSCCLTLLVSTVNTASRILSSILCEKWTQNYLVFYFTILPNLR